MIPFVVLVAAFLLLRLGGPFRARHGNELARLCGRQ